MSFAGLNEGLERDAGGAWGRSSDAGPRVHWLCFGMLAGLFSLICDGWSGKPSPLLHQVLLLPADCVYVLLVGVLLSPPFGRLVQGSRAVLRAWKGWLGIVVAFEAASIVLIGIEAHHFRAFGYHLTVRALVLGLGVLVAGWVWYAVRRDARGLLAAVVGSYVGASVLAVLCYPLNYLRSDMLPVIVWADQRWLSHMNPYATMRVGARLYDFPYLPGMLIAFWPAVAARVDVRFATLVYLLAAVALIWWSSRRDRRLQVASLLGLFLLCPFLQYRHDLYLEPHWFLVSLAVVLMQRRRFVWAAGVWGASCAVYQLSWVLIPFVFLNAYRRRGWIEAVKLLAASSAGVLLVAGPLLASALHRIGRNTVGQWAQLPHALADPINASYWVTYLIRPSQLQWLQAAVLVGIFVFCWWRGRCFSLVDTLRWMCCALAVFIPLNVIVDGYFYLTLLLLLLLFVCVANDWWREPALGLGNPKPMTGSNSPAVPAGMAVPGI